MFKYLAQFCGLLLLASPSLPLMGNTLPSDAPLHCNSRRSSCDSHFYGGFVGYFPTQGNTITFPAYQPIPFANTTYNHGINVNNEGTLFTILKSGTYQITYGVATSTTALPNPSTNPRAIGLFVNNNLALGGWSAISLANTIALNEATLSLKAGDVVSVQVGNTSILPTWDVRTWSDQPIVSAILTIQQLH